MKLETKLNVTLIWNSLTALAKELETTDANAARIVIYAARIVAMAVPRSTTNASCD